MGKWISGFDRKTNRSFRRWIIVKISLLIGEVIFTLVWLIYRGITVVVQKRFCWKQEALLLLMYINLSVIIRFVFYPFFAVDGQVQPLIIQAREIFPPRINLIPFLYITDYEVKREALINIIGNVSLFIPTGIILPILYKRLNSFWNVLLAGAGISLCIEVIQLLLSNSVTDIDDLILNTAGVIIGYAVFSLVRRLIKRA